MGSARRSDEIAPLPLPGAPAPHYHLTQITIPGAVDVFVADINNAGQAVGHYVDADVGIFIATPIADDAIFVDGFDG